MAMRGWLTIIVLWLGGFAISRAVQPMPLSKPAVRKEICETIETQLAAFRADDWSAAYACASNAFRERIPEPAFVAMITRSYRPVWKNTRADLGLARDDGASARVPIRVFGENGRSTEYDYLLVKDPAGWRVAGVLPKPAAGPGT